MERTRKKRTNPQNRKREGHNHDSDINLTVFASMLKGVSISTGWVAVCPPLNGDGGMHQVKEPPSTHL